MTNTRQTFVAAFIFFVLICFVYCDYTCSSDEARNQTIGFKSIFDPKCGKFNAENVDAFLKCCENNKVDLKSPIEECEKKMNWKISKTVDYFKEQVCKKSLQDFENIGCCIMDYIKENEKRVPDSEKRKAIYKKCLDAKVK